MSHNIRYEILEENVNKQKVMAHIQEIANLMETDIVQI